VNDPQNPTPRRSFIRGVSPNVDAADADVIAFLAGVDADAEAAVVVAAVATANDEGSIRGDPKTPPKMKEPRTLIPAVCQPVHIECEVS